MEIKMFNASVLATTLLLTLTPASPVAPSTAQALQISYGPEVAEITCFLSGEKTSGMNKICFYDCLGSEAAITIKNYELCPLTIKR